MDVNNTDTNRTGKRKQSTDEALLRRVMGWLDNDENAIQVVNDEATGQHDESIQVPNNNSISTGQSLANDAETPLEGSDNTGHIIANDAETSLEGSNKVIIIELIERSKEEQLILDKATLLNLLNNSLFKDKYSGRPRYNYTKHQLVLSINEAEDVPGLLQMKNLQDADG